MKKFLGILIISISLCGNAKSFFHKDPFVSWNFDKGYVYVALQNNQNLNEEINRGLPLETISKLNCSNGLKKIKLKTLPPGYAEDVPELLKKKFQPLNMYKFSCATAVVEKPKNQEPEIKFNSLDLKETLVYWGLKIDNYFN